MYIWKVWYSRKCHGSLASGAHGTWLPTDTQTGNVPLGAWGCSLERTDLSSHMPKYMKTRNGRFDCSCRQEDDAGLSRPLRSACPKDSCPSAWQDHCGRSVWGQGTETTRFLINLCAQLSIGKNLLWNHHGFFPQLLASWRTWNYSDCLSICYFKTFSFSQWTTAFFFLSEDNYDFAHKYVTVHI